MKNKLLALVSVVIVGLLVGCNSAAQLNNIHIGMSKDQVLSIMGTPNSTSAQANIEYLTYYLEGDANYGRDQPYMIRLVDGKVESYGRFSQLNDLYVRPVAGETNIPASPYQNMMAPTGTMPVPAAVPSSDIGTQLEKLKALKDQGVLSDEEFQRAKAKLLSSQQ